MTRSPSGMGPHGHAGSRRTCQACVKPLSFVRGGFASTLSAVSSARAAASDSHRSRRSSHAPIQAETRAASSTVGRYLLALMSAADAIPRRAATFLRMAEWSSMRPSAGSSSRAAIGVKSLCRRTSACPSDRAHRHLERLGCLRREATTPADVSPRPTSANGSHLKRKADPAPGVPHPPQTRRPRPGPRRPPRRAGRTRRNAKANATTTADRLPPTAPPRRHPLERAEGARSPGARNRRRKRAAHGLSSTDSSAGEPCARRRRGAVVIVA